MTNSMQLVWALAQILHARGTRVSGRDLARLLNAAGLRTSYGTPYAGGRGTYRLIRATYHHLKSAGLTAEAAVVAGTYTRPSGHYAY